MDRCGASTLVMWACAVSAMASCNASAMAWPAVPTTAHDGIVLQAGTPLSQRARCYRPLGDGEHMCLRGGQAVGHTAGVHALFDVGVANAAGGARERDHVQVRGHGGEEPVEGRHVQVCGRPEPGEAGVVDQHVDRTAMDPEVIARLLARNPAPERLPR